MCYQKMLLCICLWMCLVSFSFVGVNGIEGVVNIDSRAFIGRIVFCAQLLIGGRLRNVTMENAVGIMLLYLIWYSFISESVKKVFKEFLRKSGEWANVVTHHIYNLEPGMFHKTG
jgi:hypothetical protein